MFIIHSSVFVIHSADRLTHSFSFRLVDNGRLLLIIHHTAHRYYYIYGTQALKSADFTERRQKADLYARLLNNTGRRRGVPVHHHYRPPGSVTKVLQLEKPVNDTQELLKRATPEEDSTPKKGFGSRRAEDDDSDFSRSNSQDSSDDSGSDDDDSTMPPKQTVPRRVNLRDQLQELRGKRRALSNKQIVGAAKQPSKKKTRTSTNDDSARNKTRSSANHDSATANPETERNNANSTETPAKPRHKRRYARKSVKNGEAASAPENADSDQSCTESEVTRVTPPETRQRKRAARRPKQPTNPNHKLSDDGMSVIVPKNEYFDILEDAGNVPFLNNEIDKLKRDVDEQTSVEADNLEDIKNLQLELQQSMRELEALQKSNEKLEKAVSDLNEDLKKATKDGKRAPNKDIAGKVKDYIRVYSYRKTKFAVGEANLKEFADKVYCGVVASGKCPDLTNPDSAHKCNNEEFVEIYSPTCQTKLGDCRSYTIARCTASCTSEWFVCLFGPCCFCLV